MVMCQRLVPTQQRTYNLSLDAAALLHPSLSWMLPASQPHAAPACVLQRFKPAAHLPPTCDHPCSWRPGRPLEPWLPHT